MLNLVEEAKFAELKDKCRELHVPSLPEIMIGLKVHDKNGVLTFDDVQRGHSWTRNLYNLLMGTCTSCGSSVQSSNFGAGYLTGTNRAGTITYATTTTGAQHPGAYSGVGLWGETGSDIRGILVGTSDTAFSVEQYGLQALITHGGSTGQFAYQDTSVGVPAYTAGTKTWKVTTTRMFNNNSGASITVKETGLMANMYLYSTGAFLLERSVLSPTVAVANGAQLTVTYETSMDFSAID